MNYIKLLDKKATPGGYVELWDFSRANDSIEARIEAVSQVASVCFGNKAPLKKDVLFDRLSRESLGLPSSSFEFIPVVFDLEGETPACTELMPKGRVPSILKYGEVVKKDNKEYLLTNYRALLSDVEFSGADKEEWIERSLTKNDIERDIIRRNFIVTKHKMDIVTARQFMRHRDSWQELSRRYTTGKKVPIEVYISSAVEHSNAKVIVGEEELYAPDVIDIAIAMYEALLKDGVKAQEARRVIPIGLLTQVWSARTRSSFENLYQLRSEPKAQDEIRALAKAMRGLVDEHLQ